jgi:hypothetical protein
MNTFIDKPEFITSDIRTQRPSAFSYPLTPELLTTRHDLFFRDIDLTGKTILDLGSCCGGTGAWVLDRGAKHYTGVEVQEKFVEISANNLSKYYRATRWSIVKSGIEEYLDSYAETYDIAVLCGCLHCLFHYQKILRRITEISKHAIIETFQPYNCFKELFGGKTDEEYYQLSNDLSLVQVAARTTNAGELGGSYIFDGTRLSIAAIKNTFGYLGWATDTEINKSAIKELPSVYSFETKAYSPRYVVRASPDKKTVFEFVDGYRNIKDSNYGYKSW